MRALRILALTTAGLAYMLIVLGAFVRITGSGLGCGDDWPLCNGRLIPPLNDPATLIEYSHRIVAAALSIMVVAVAVLAFVMRRSPGGSGSRGTLRPALLAAGLLVAQVFLGAITVWLELPPSAVVLHFSAALALLAVLVVTGLRAEHQAPQDGAATPGRLAMLGAAVLGAGVMLVGGLTANLGAGPACLGFPLCTGAMWPPSTESGLAHLHWAHRLLAYGLLAHLMALALHLWRRRAPTRHRVATGIALGFATLQVTVAAVMVLAHLPPLWRGLHATVGTALWIALVYLAWLAFQGRAADSTSHRSHSAAVTHPAMR